jgi:hypothetical protein
MNAVELRRVDPSRNMRRFYRLDMQPDLIGGMLLRRPQEAAGLQVVLAHASLGFSSERPRRHLGERSGLSKYQNWVSFSSGRRSSGECRDKARMRIETSVRDVNRAALARKGPKKSQSFHP